MRDANPPAITFRMKAGRITIFRSTLSAIGYPEFYRFLYNRERRQIAIEPCEMDAPGSYAGVKKDDTYEISSIDLLRMLYRDNGWKNELSYRVPGLAYSDERIVEFDLTKAMEIIDGKVQESDVAVDFDTEEDDTIEII